MSADNVDEFLEKYPNAGVFGALHVKYGCHNPEDQEQWSKVRCPSLVCSYYTRTSLPWEEMHEHLMSRHVLDADTAEKLFPERRKNTAEHHCQTCGQRWERRKGQMEIVRVTMNISRMDKFRNITMTVYTSDNQTYSYNQMLPVNDFKTMFDEIMQIMVEGIKTRVKDDIYINRQMKKD